MAGTSTVWWRRADSRDTAVADAPEADASCGERVEPAAWLTLLTQHADAGPGARAVRFMTFGGGAGVSWFDRSASRFTAWGDALAGVLPATLPRSERPWRVVPRAAIEALSQDPELRAAATARLTNRARGMLERRAEGARRGRRAAGPEVAALRDQGAVACAFAQAGGFALLGQRLAWLTRPCPQGRHVRLVAPWAQRVEAVTSRRELTAREAAEHLQRLDRSALRWRRRFWPDADPADGFAMSCNVAAMTPCEVARAAVALLAPG